MPQTKTLESLSEHIENVYHVGWRKGVDGEGSGEIWRTLGSGYDSQNPVVRNILEQHLNAVTTAAASVLMNNPQATDEELGQAMKQAACVEYTATNKEPRSFDEQGKKIFRAMLPLEYTIYGCREKVDVDIPDHPGDEPSDSLYTYRWNEEKVQWDKFRYLDYNAVFGAHLVAFNLVMSSPELMERYSEIFTQSTAKEFSQALYQASLGVTDDGWEALASWIKYCLE